MYVYVWTITNVKDQRLTDEQLKSLSRHTIFPDPFNPDQNPNPEMKRISETMENETKIHEKLGNLFYYNLMLYSVVH